MRFNFNHIRSINAILVLLIITFFACKRKQAKWDVNGLVPLFSSSLSLSDVDQRYLQPTLGDSSFLLVYDKLVYSSRSIDVRTPDTSIESSFNLRRLKLNDRTITQTITLAQINPLFQFLNGQTQTIPAQSQSNLNPVNIDASAFFESATLDSGFLDIGLSNELPVNARLVVFELRNTGDNSVVALDSFNNLASGSTITKIVNLRNKTVTKDLKAVIKSLETDASNGPVLIDASKGVQVKLTVRNLRPREATAAFPNQTVIDQDEGLVLDMGGPQVKYFKVKSGKLRIKIISTIQENMSMFFKIPSAIKNGVDVERNVKLAGAPAGGNIVAEEIVDLSGYLIDFRGKNPNIKDTVNTFHQILKVNLDSSGRKVNIKLRDSLRILYQLDELLPDYAIGYLGKTLNKTGYASTPFELFKGASGSIALSATNTSILIANTVGAEGQIKVNKLEGENLYSTSKVTLNATPFNSAINVDPAVLQINSGNASIIPKYKSIVLTDANSNAKQFLENLPQKIYYDLDIETNPGGNTSNYKDFVTADSRVDVFLRFETPAKFNIGGLTLRDTQSLDFSKLSEPERIKMVKLVLDIENAFPFEVELQAQLLDANYNYLETLDFSNNAKIQAGKTDNFGRPAGSTSTKLEIKLPKDKIGVIKKTKFIGIVATIKGNGTQQKIYNSYIFKIKCNGEFIYEARL